MTNIIAFTRSSMQRFYQQLKQKSKQFLSMAPISFINALLTKNISANASSDSVVGRIEPPPGVDLYQEQVNGEIGIILFLSRLIELATVAAGIWMLINLIIAGWTYLTSAGDASAHEEVSKRIMNSIIGLGLIVFSYLIAGLIGLLLFGDAGFILHPTLRGINGIDNGGILI